MTTTTELPQFYTRQEGDGYVVYVPDTGTYLYADAAAHEALAELRAHRSVDQVGASIAVQLSKTEGEAKEFVAALVDVLAGRRSSVGGSGQYLLLCPLSDVAGDSAYRCETFGMPL